ncbi:MAG: hypothetical protein HQL73_10125 [Magnetococcales bacterium]|nr:hypothetical protein [Magnetococcales bacterium]
MLDSSSQHVDFFVRKKGPTFTLCNPGNSVVVQGTDLNAAFQMFLREQEEHRRLLTDAGREPSGNQRHGLAMAFGLMRDTLAYIGRVATVMFLIVFTLSIAIPATINHVASYLQDTVEGGFGPVVIGGLDRMVATVGRIGPERTDKIVESIRLIRTSLDPIVRAWQDPHVPDAPAARPMSPSPSGKPSQPNATGNDLP